MSGYKCISAKVRWYVPGYDGMCQGTGVLEPGYEGISARVRGY